MAKNKVEITGINTSELETLSQGEMAKLFKQTRGNSEGRTQRSIGKIGADKLAA